MNPVQCDGVFYAQTLLKRTEFNNMKRERVNRHHYLTRAEARADIFDCVERFHNRKKDVC